MSEDKYYLFKWNGSGDKEGKFFGIVLNDDSSLSFEKEGITISEGAQVFFEIFAELAQGKFKINETKEEIKE